ncbi:MAG TPA: haloacid dehalogenase-like hydrolase [Polyangiaceae bacterium LLY-WYZ-14_1]|nr:haloacid dehalogenase-like hydrolase [Polyangiaceae bacterium LLY-WYZ-14_1]
MASHRQGAAFLRVEGVLVRRPGWAAAAWLAGNAQEVGERLARVGNVLASLPFQNGPLGDARLAARVTWMGLRGMSEDRLVVLGEEYAERFLIPNLTDSGRRLLSAARGRGLRPVLVGTGIEAVLRPLATHLGVPDLLANRLELRDGRVTGRLLDPVLAGAALVDGARRLAEELDVDLAGSAGYGATGDDGLLLGAVGLPCAVRPDRRLRQVARDLAWPVVEE